MKARKTDARVARRQDVMKTLAAARPAELDPNLLANSARQQEDLAHITAESRESPVDTSAASPARLRPRLLPLGAVATVAVSAVVLSVLVRQDAGDTTSAPTGTRPPSSAPATLNDRMELLGVAQAAETSAADGTYWQVTTRTENMDAVGEPGRRYTLRSTSTEKWSVGVRSGTRSLMLSGLDARTAPRGTADMERWRDAGSPHQVEGQVKADSRSTVRFTVGSSRPTVLHTNVGNKIYALGPKNVSYHNLRALPTDTGKLRQELVRLYGQDGGADGRTAWMLRQIANLITMPVKPGTRAAAYRVLADLPDIRVEGPATDPLGRSGVAITLPVRAATVLGDVEQRLVVDPTTGALLSDESVLVEPSAVARDAGLKSGTTVHYQATTQMEWADRQITVPAHAKEG
ncbi:CU044_5270 family protein [Streptomyces sp. Tue6028]|uniref:CU044_5270 family protein n=2 Tax=Streptomyces sp. Tue6028 TaxID=2036037 RepID=UPI003D7249E3